MLRKNEEPEDSAIANWREWVGNYWNVSPIMALIKQQKKQEQVMIDEGRQEASVGKVGKQATGEAAAVGKHIGSNKKS